MVTDTALNPAHGVRLQPFSVEFDGDARAYSWSTTSRARPQRSAMPPTGHVAAIRATLDAAGHPALLFVDGKSSIGSINFRPEEWRVDCAVGRANRLSRGRAQPAVRVATVASERKPDFVDVLTGGPSSTRLSSTSEPPRSSDVNYVRFYTEWAIERRRKRRRLRSIVRYKATIEKEMEPCKRFDRYWTKARSIALSTKAFRPLTGSPPARRSWIRPACAQSCRETGDDRARHSCSTAIAWPMSRQPVHCPSR